jgi:hypothetical protein
MSNTIRDVFNSRWKFADVARLKPIRAALDVALNAHDAVREKHTTLAKNQHLSPLGRLDDLRSFVKSATAPAVHRARATASTVRQNLAKHRSRLLPAAPDPSNMTAAVLRSEMRQHLRGLSTAARAALLLSANPDPVLIQAVLEAPSFSSGVEDDIRERMLENYAATKHPNDLAEIAQAEEALELLEAATAMALGAAKSVSEFPSESLFEDFIGKQVGAADPSDPNADLLKQLGRPPAPDKTSDEIHADAMEWGRAQVAAMRAAGEL